jgi:hemin uptake protein HemP
MSVDGLHENDYRLRVTLPKPPAPPPVAPRRIPSEALLGPDRELVIVHNGREYRLRLTQNGKLILTA